MSTVKQRLDRIERRRGRKQGRLIILLESPDGQGFVDREKTYTAAEVGELAADPANIVYTIVRRREGAPEVTEGDKE